MRNPCLRRPGYSSAKYKLRSWLQGALVEQHGRPEQHDGGEEEEEARTECKEHVQDPEQHARGRREETTTGWNRPRQTRCRAIRNR
eukprot:6289407-Pyramimonas_sp.AAC.1